MVNLKDIIISSAPTANIPSGPPPAPIILTPTPTIQVSVPPPNATTVKSPLAITILLYLLSFDLIYKLIASVVIILTLIKTFRNNHLLAHIFETSPFLCLMPIFAAVLIVYVFILILKTSSFTQYNYRLFLISSIVLPIIYGTYVHFLLPQPHLLIAAFFNEISLISLLITALLIFLPKKFSTYSPELGTAQVAIFTLVSSLILFPTFAFTYSLINSSLYPDLDQVKIEKMVGHKLYTSANLPQNLVVGSQFYVSDTKDKNLTEPTVKISYTAPKTTVILSQTKVQSDFDLLNYVNSSQTNTSADKIVVTTALHQEGYLKIVDPKSGSLNLRALYFITPDRLLITIISPNTNITADDLLQIAQSLR